MPAFLAVCDESLVDKPAIYSADKMNHTIYSPTQKKGPYKAPENLN